MMSPSRTLRPILALIVVGHVALVPVGAQSPRPMGIVDLLNVARLADPRLSPDGRDVLYARTEADWKAANA